MEIAVIAVLGVIACLYLAAPLVMLVEWMLYRGDNT